jgi:phytoene dehydrogenase-like protein
MSGQAADSADAVVIGAGPNGLVAANLLADAGWSVLVLEAADAPGGAVRTAEVTAPGFRNDLYSAFYPFGVASPVLVGLELERYGLRWRHAPAVLAHVLPDDRCALLSKNVAETAESVAAFAASDAQAWSQEFLTWQRVRRDLLDALLRPFPPVRAASRLLRGLGSAESVRLARLATLPVRRLGEERFAGQGAQLLLAGNALHTDLGPDSTGGGLFGWLLAMLGQDVGFPVPEGGAEAITTALLRRLQARGGRVACGRGVNRVLVAGGKALGVRDVTGGLVRAHRAVLADVPAPALYLGLVGADHLPPRLVRDLEHFQWDNATIKVDWALSSPIPWTAEPAGQAGTVHVGADLNGLTSYSADLHCGRVPKKPFLVVGQMTTADPSRSPAGTEAAWAYTHLPHGRRWNSSELRRHVERMEQVLEHHAPGFRDRILARHIAGPPDMERSNPSLVNGALGGGTSAVHQGLIFRPVPGLARADTPIDRLFLASASAHPGGGVHGAPGANAARAALARAGMGGACYAAAVRGAHRLIYG